MKKLPLLFSIALLLVHANAVFAAASPVIAKGEISLDKHLAKNAQGIRTLFISVYDPANPAPMPVGATKIDLTRDAAGTFTKFTLDPGSMMMMGSGSLPPKINIKAKLDRDGNAGPDVTGDLTGWVRGVKLGDEHVKIKIDTAVR